VFDRHFKNRRDDVAPVARKAILRENDRTHDQRNLPAVVRIRRAKVSVPEHNGEALVLKNHAFLLDVTTIPFGDLSKSEQMIKNRFRHEFVSSDVSVEVDN